MLAGKKRSISADSENNCALHKECDEALCPVCMEHPHNAVLLVCSSHGKGCRPYICDTSYRHSNCLDRYRKLKMDSNPSPDNLEISQQPNLSNTSAPRSGAQAGNSLPEISETQLQRGESSRNQGYDDVLNENLKCPLCRGDVLRWEVTEEARKYLNLKTRSCSRESCSFVGNYSELRRHARSLHPFARPSEIDPSRQRAWRRFEHQREYSDIVSAIQSAIPGAVVFGDYIIENGNNDRIPNERGRTSGGLNEPLWSTFFLFQMFGSMEPRNRSRGTWSRNRQTSRRRYLWGENLLGARNGSDGGAEEPNISNSNNDNMPARRRRRRLTRTRSSIDRP